jgi:hypothetical protein
MTEQERIRLLEDIVEWDTKAQEAFLRSKYAISEYWLCLVFRVRRLLKSACDVEVPRGPFELWLLNQKRELAKTTNKLGDPHHTH